MNRNKILILGATGMLGHVLFLRLSESKDLDVYGTVRNLEVISEWLSPKHLLKLDGNVEAESVDSVLGLLVRLKPDQVVNCIGIIKKAPAARDPLISIYINALFPHRLALACKAVGARLIQISTDCVFSGSKGNYNELDQSDATDLYGRTKFLGEVSYPYTITLRTSIIGHELRGKYGLVEWFLARQGEIKGFARAIYSGLTTIEFSRIIMEYVIPNEELNGLYHVSSDPISKYELLKLIAQRYNKRIRIEPDEDFRLDRSLDSTLFRKATRYSPPSWPELIDTMHQDWKKNEAYKQ